MKVYFEYFFRYLIAFIIVFFLVYVIIYSHNYFSKNNKPIMNPNFVSNISPMNNLNQNSSNEIKK
jgi:hypothetical protein